MNLTILDAGVEYFYYTEANRARAHITHVALGSEFNYVLTPGALGFQNAPLLQLSVDSMELNGDTATFQVTLGPEVVLTFGEVALLSNTGVFVAANVPVAQTVKLAGTTLVLSLSINQPGLAARLTYRASSVSLSSTRTSFDDVLLQLQSAAFEKTNLKTIVRNDVTTVLLEVLAGIADFESAAIESAYQETFPDTAKLSSSQYAIQTMLRTRLTRKRPASVYTTLSRASTVAGFTIPPYTQFESQGVSLFNRDAILFPVGVPSQPAILYEGRVKRISTPGSSTDYQFFISDERDFQVSDLDVLVTLDATSIPVVSDPLWNYRNKPAVEDFTNKHGSLLLLFGNELLATKPRISETVHILYVITLGASGNQTFLGSSISCSAFPDVSGEATSHLYGGGDSPPLTFYQRLGGDAYGGKKGAVTRSQYTAKAREYPGVVDAVVKGQADLAPSDSRWFNTVKVVLLTNSPWSNQDKLDFLAWYQQRTMYSTRYDLQVGDVGEEPRKRLVNIDLKVFCRPEANLTAVQSAVFGAVRALFSPRAGILGRDIYVSDITNSVLSSGGGMVDYVNVVTPTTTLVSDLASPLVTSILQVGLGQLAPGAYSYSVTSVDADGESAPTTALMLVPSANGAVQLSWPAVPGAVSYSVYGRSGQNLGRLWTGTTTLFTDNGSASPAFPFAPSVSTSGVHYPAINNLSVAVSYSIRREAT